jgi:hypothetical protein
VRGKWKPVKKGQNRRSPDRGERVEGGEMGEGGDKDSERAWGIAQELLGLRVHGVGRGEWKER